MLDWYASPRFLREYRRASPPLQGLAEQEVQYLQQVAGSRKDWMNQWDRVAGTGGATILELKLGGGPRALAHVGEGAVTLVPMGDHEITPRYARADTLRGDLSKRTHLPPQFKGGQPGGFFPPSREGSLDALIEWGPERSPEWLYFLDDEQTGVFESIVLAVEDVLLDEGFSRAHFIIGGPGTGKTSVLLQLLKHFGNSAVAGSDTWEVGVAISDRVAAYVAASTGWRLDHARALSRARSTVEILLIDDPASEAQIESALRDAHTSPSLKAVVVGFDPLQLDDSLSDAEYQRMVGEYEVMEHRLRSSYRQKRVIGEYALQVATTVAGSSPFLDDDKQRKYAKQRRKLTNRANFISFPNPSGNVVTYEDASLSQCGAYVRWVGGQPTLWRHWTPLAVFRDASANLPVEWLDTVDDARVAYELVDIANLESVKGLEYQHVALCIGAERYDDLTAGFSGSGRRLYNEYRLLRIPFTRAKDSIAVFVLRG